MIINGTNHDGMDMWHILNSDLKKSLGFVTPFICHGQRMWKNESGSSPAYYNAVDASTAGQNARGIMKLLKQHGMWNIYNEFICELDPVFSAMTRAGMPVDLARRVESSKQLIEKRHEVRAKIEAVVPNAIRVYSPPNGYVKTPADVSGLTEITLGAVSHQECSRCAERDPKKAHYKSKLARTCSVCGAKWTAKHTATRKRSNNPCSEGIEVRTETNRCAGASSVEVVEGEKRWARLEPFKASTKGIQRYQQYFKHPLIITGKGADRKVTCDEKAVSKLIGRHPDHKFYEWVLEERELSTIGSRYIGWYDVASGAIAGGFPVGRDGRVRGIFRHTPSTLRSSMVSPNLQNIPRGDDSDIQKLVKMLFVAQQGHIFIERDFSGIEAKLVGYHCGSKDYIRLAAIDVHSYLTAYNLYRQGRFTAADLPNLAWSDADLGAYLKQIKKTYPNERTVAKIIVHSSNYRIGPKELSEQHPTVFHRIKDAARGRADYYEVFPEIPAWHERLCLQVDKSCVYKNSFGHIQRFYSVLAWSKKQGKWDWDYGDDAKRLIAAGPQSDAAFIIKKALKRLYYNYPDTIAQWLRLLIHDSNFAECPIDQADYCDETMKFEMEKPVEELPLDPSWGLGQFLHIGTESKRGVCWGEMK
jgi:DNA polymerase I-like protein with 3'-5' exonuclease and polymerase domains